MNKAYLALIIISATALIISLSLLSLIDSGIKIDRNLNTITSDGVIISFNLYKPFNGSNATVILGHGISSNKESLDSLAVELARAGFNTNINNNYSITIRKII